MTDGIYQELATTPNGKNQIDRADDLLRASDHAVPCLLHGAASALPLLGFGRRRCGGGCDGFLFFKDGGGRGHSARGKRRREEVNL